MSIQGIGRKEAGGRAIKQESSEERRWEGGTPRSRRLRRGIDVRVNESMLYFVPLRCHVGACACAFVCGRLRAFGLVV